MEATRTLPSFQEMGVDEPIREALLAMGFAAPMEVQAVALRPILDGKDLLVQARTGSGKTAAFGIPIAQSLVRPGEAGPQVLVLEPTRELALQVAHECGRIGKPRSTRIVPIYGGAPIGPQRKALADGVDVVVGTPGRVLDHLGRGWLDLGHVRTVVLDEGDEMLSRGFLEDIERILGALPAAHQTLLFSATVPDGIARLAQRHQREPIRIDLSGDYIAAREVKHAYYLVTGGSRMQELIHVLDVERPDSALIFCNTREETGVVAAYLQRHGLDAEPISSDLVQKDRERVMARMKAGNLKFLVATDVAARGIDISGLGLVVNFSFPESPDAYVHRTGRTGRAGRAGLAISLVAPRELGSLYYLKLVHKISPDERHLPTEAERRARWEAERLADLARRLPADPGAELTALARRLGQSNDGERLIAGLLHEVLRPAPEQGQPAPAERKPPQAPGSGEQVSARSPAPAEADPSAPGRAREFWEQWAESKEQQSAEPGAFQPSEPAHAPAEESRTEPGAGMVRLYLNIGRKEEVSPAEVVTLLRERAGVTRPELGRIQVRDNHCYASVTPSAADRVIQALSGTTFKGRALIVEPARRN